jgi:hypothetical protein
VGGNPSVGKVADPVVIPLPEPSIVSGGDFKRVVRKKRFTPSPVNTAAVTSTTKKPRVTMIGVKNSSSLSGVQKSVCMKSLSVSRFFPDVTATVVEKSLQEQLQLASLVCTRLKTKHNSYNSFHLCPW